MLKLIFILILTPFFFAGLSNAATLSCHDELQLDPKIDFIPGRVFVQVASHFGGLRANDSFVKSLPRFVRIFLKTGNIIEQISDVAEIYNIKPVDLILSLANQSHGLKAFAFRDQSELINATFNSYDEKFERGRGLDFSVTPSGIGQLKCSRSDLDYLIEQHVFPSESRGLSYLPVSTFNGKIFVMKVDVEKPTESGLFHFLIFKTGVKDESIDFLEEHKLRMEITGLIHDAVATLYAQALTQSDPTAFETIVPRVIEIAKHDHPKKKK